MTDQSPAPPPANAAARAGTDLTPAADRPGRGLVSAATLVIGSSGSGKSSILATLAEWGWQHFHKWSSYYLCDSGGVPTQVQGLVNRGIIKLWRLRTRSGAGLAPETIHRASQGWWPRRINPLTGEVDPTVELVAPVTETISVSCAAGHPYQVVRFSSQIKPGVCATCGVAVRAENWKLARTSTVTRGFEGRGFCLFDGLYSAGEWLLDDLSHRQLGGEQSRLGGVVESGGLRFGENNRAQVGFTQTRAASWLANANSIPGLIVPPVWTALIKEGELEGLRIKGPDLGAGQAKTAVAPQWVGNCIETAVVEEDGKKYRRLYLQEYIDKDGFRHLLKIRSFPGMIPSFLQDEDRDDMAEHERFVNFNLGLLHDLFEKSRIALEARYVEKYPDAPGVVVEAEEFGEGPLSAVPSPAGSGSGGSAPAAPAPAARTSGGAARIGGGRAARIGPPPAPVGPVATPAPAPAASRATPAPAPSAPAAAAPATPPETPPAPPQSTQAARGPAPVGPPPAPRAPARGPVPAPPGARPRSRA